MSEQVIRASVAQQYPQVTTIGPAGGIGLGHIIDGTAYKSGGNGFYYPAENGTEILRDGGKGYVRAIRGLALPPAYAR